MSGPAQASNATQCRGQRVARPCTAEPRFVVSYGRFVEYACGHHMTSAVLHLADEHAGGSSITVRARW